MNRPSMATSLHPTTRRLVGLMLILSGGLLSLGLLLRVGAGVYGWYTAGGESPSALLLSTNLVGLLASGLLMRMGLRMRRGQGTQRNPNTNEIL